MIAILTNITEDYGTNNKDRCGAIFLIRLSQRSLWDLITTELIKTA